MAGPENEDLRYLLYHGIAMYLLYVPLTPHPGKYADKLSEKYNSLPNYFPVP